MKFFKFSSICLLVAVSFSMAAKATIFFDDQTRKTTTGLIFTRSTQFPQLGESWQAPALAGKPGLIWGDIMVDHQKRPLKLTIHEARLACQQIGARLPTKDEFEILRQMFGAKPKTFKGYIPQVLPHLGKGLWYWAWPAETNGDVYEFISEYGDIAANSAYDMNKYNPHDYFRCVISPN